MKITIHRGIKQIGGCITEIRSSKGTKILIDLGHNLPEGDKPANDPFDSEENLGKLLEDVKAVFYTHAHGDHTGFEVQVARKGIRQYIGNVAKEMMLVLKKHMTYADDLKARAEASYLAINDFCTYRADETVCIDDIRITPYYVSHSAADAYMFVVECDNHRLLHTGDFRDHGYRGRGLMPMVNYYVARQKIDILITEGTMLDREDHRLMTEEALQEQAVALMQKYDNVFVMCSSMDADRLASFYLATQKFPERKFIVDGYQWKQLNTIENTLGKDPRGWRYRFRKKLYYHKHKENILRDISTGKMTMLVRNNHNFRHCIDEIYPLLNPRSICFIYSQFRGYLLPSHKAYQQKTYDFVHYKPWTVEYLHTSGHASREALTAVCEKVHPRLAIIPIHRDTTGDFSTLDIGEELKTKIITETRFVDDIEIIIK